MINRMKELITILNEANKAYYQDAQEIMSNKEYDALYEELLQLEKETGTVMSNSPSHHVGYDVVSSLPKEMHKTPMLSLDKTKDREALKRWLGMQEGIMSWKLDGLTVVLTYENGELTKAVTRGNGEVGELITQNAKKFFNLPLTITKRDGIITIRGETVITYPEFDRINSLIPETESQYKNPRNLCSGTVRQLDSRIVGERHVRFVAFELLNPITDTVEESYEYLSELGFDVVEHQRVVPGSFDEVFDWFKEKLGTGQMEIPTDGLVLRYNDIQYGASLGRTDKFPRHSMAFKWADEEAATILKDIEWSTSRTGQINPVAVFEPVELEGTTVERASLHNVSIIEKLQLGIGDEITVYKANMIIPQVAENLTKSGSYQMPENCPDCGFPTEIRQENGSKVLYCTNPNCKAKLLARFTHFVSRECMNIDGLSEETLRKLLDDGQIEHFSDLYALADSQEAIRDIMKMPGMGRKSVQNLLDSIEKSKTVRLDNFINAMGIPGIGKKQAKQIAEYVHYSYDEFYNYMDSGLRFTYIPGFGDVLNQNIYDWFGYVASADFEDLALLMDWVIPEKETEDTLAGKIFVITGSLEKFKSRKEAQEAIESAGGKVSGSVSSKTNYLVNNNVGSTSSKNKKAKELGIPIITEGQLIEMIGG